MIMILFKFQPYLYGQLWSTDVKVYNNISSVIYENTHIKNNTTYQGKKILLRCEANKNILKKKNHSPHPFKLNGCSLS